MQGQVLDVILDTFFTHEGKEYIAGSHTFDLTDEKQQRVALDLQAAQARVIKERDDEIERLRKNSEALAGVTLSMSEYHTPPVSAEKIQEMIEAALSQQIVVLKNQGMLKEQIGESTPENTGPSEEDIQARIDAAVQKALDDAKPLDADTKDKEPEKEVENKEKLEVEDEPKRKSVSIKT